MLLFMIVLNFYLPQAANVIISPQNRTVNQGQSFDLNVSIDPKGAAISGAQLNIAFNKTLLNLNSVTEGTLFTQNGSSTYFNNGTINNSEGIVRNIFGVILGPGNISTSGTFVTLNFTASGQSGTSDILLSNVLISDPNALAFPLITSNTSVNINSAPVMGNIGNKNTYKGQTLSFTVLATDTNGDPLTYSASNLPSGAIFNAATATFHWTPAQSGVYSNVYFAVSDGSAIDHETITITVNNISEIQVMPSFNNVTFGQDLTMNVTIDPKGTGIAGAQLNIAVNRSILRINNIIEGDLFKQGGANTIFNSGAIDNSKGTVANIYVAIIGQTNVTTKGTFITINATAIGSSGSSGFDLTNIMVTDQLGSAVVYNLTNGSVKINDPPVLSTINSRAINEGQTLSFNVAASDINGDLLSYSVSNVPQGATFDPSTKTFTWTPTFFQSGTYQNVRFEVTDGYLTDSENITITVNNMNRAPASVYAPSNGSIYNETDIIYIRATASDLDNDTLNYSIMIDGSKVSTSASYNWTTNYSNSGNHVITFDITDGTDIVSKTISVYVNNIYPRYDVNENGVVDIGDIAVIGQHFNEAVSSPYPRYDVNMDGVVNIMDIVLAGQHFGEAT